MATKLEIDENGRVLEFEIYLDYFHPMKHIPPTNPNDRSNGSPVIGMFFVGVDGGMQNAQKLVGVGGTAKYVCKYLFMVDTILPGGKMIEVRQYHFIDIIYLLMFW